MNENVIPLNRDGARELHKKTCDLCRDTEVGSVNLHCDEARETCLENLVNIGLLTSEEVQSL